MVTSKQAYSGNELFTASIHYHHFDMSASWKRGKGRGCGNRGVDFGLGIGYSSESKNTSTGRSSAVNSLKTGVMAQFKSSFIAASSNSQNQGMLMGKLVLVSLLLDLSTLGNH